jgi:hypothetical protein
MWLPPSCLRPDACIFGKAGISSVPRLKLRETMPASRWP